MNLICGINPVLEALQAAKRHFDRLLIVKGIRNKRVSDAIARAGQMGIPLRFEARETLDRMAGGVPHQGLIAVVSAKPVIDLDQLLDEAKTPAFVVVLDGVEDPRNLGAILRTVEASGADGVVLPDRHSAGLNETVSRASAGGMEHVRIARIGNVSQALEAMKARGLWVVGFDASGTERWDTVDLTRPIALVLGGEGRGIRRLVRERCDHLVSLPLFGHVNSLNVSVAAGIALYEAVRQRGAVPSHVRPIPPRSAAGARHVEGPAQDDSEEDPGRSHVPVDDSGYEDDDPDRPMRVTDDEAPAWAGPTVLKPLMGRRTTVRGGPPRRGGRPDRNRSGRTGGGRGRAPEGERGRGPEAERGGPEGARGPDAERGGPRATPPNAGREGTNEVPGSPAGENGAVAHPRASRDKRRRRRGGAGRGSGPSLGEGGAPRDAAVARPEHGGGSRDDVAPAGPARDDGAPRESRTGSEPGGGGAPGDNGAPGGAPRKRRRRRRH